MSLSFHTFDARTGRLDPAMGSVTSYPGGDTSVRHLEPVTAEKQHPVAWNLGGTLDYAALGQWVAFHTAESTLPPVLVMPYLPSARGDRDSTRDAQVAARLTAATGIRLLITADPHSPAWAAAAGPTWIYAVGADDLVGGSTLAAPHWDWTAVIAPDKGAVNRAGDVARILGVPLLTAGKVRDAATGKLSGFAAPAEIGAGRFLVIDDICDGGGTFAGLAVAIAEVAPEAELHLWVTHGLFTGHWRENVLQNYVSVSAADTAAGSENSPLPYGVRAVRLLPHVLEQLNHIHRLTTEAA
ncbi:MAG: phosphoribosyltransferase family protein [Leucobacter sp.]